VRSQADGDRVEQLPEDEVYNVFGLLEAIALVIRFTMASAMVNGCFGIIAGVLFKLVGAEDNKVVEGVPVFGWVIFAMIFGAVFGLLLSIGASLLSWHKLTSTNTEVQAGCKLVAEARLLCRLVARTIRWVMTRGFWIVLLGSLYGLAEAESQGSIVVGVILGMFVFTMFAGLLGLMIEAAEMGF
jgi:hypothetical protein